MYLSYRSVGDMNETLIKNLYKFPHDVDLVVGIPRSGMLPANLLALYLNKPFTDIDSFLEGRIYSSGERGKFIEKSKFGSVLIMDDSINSRGSLNKAKKKVLEFKNAHNNINIKYGVVYATTTSKHLVDVYCEIIDGARVFQWNIFHHCMLSNAILDIDGVLCPNPPVDDDGPVYSKHISTAPLLYKPTVKIDKLVSCRLEKYRPVTEKWLANNGIKYNELIMLNLETKQQRQLWGKHGEFKGKIYSESSDSLFIESSLKEARQISKISRKPVFCIENFEMINNESMKDRLIRILQQNEVGRVILNVLFKLYHLIR